MTQCSPRVTRQSIPRRIVARPRTTRRAVTSNIDFIRAAACRPRARIVKWGSQPAAYGVGTAARMGCCTELHDAGSERSELKEWVHRQRGYAHGLLSNDH